MSKLVGVEFLLGTAVAIALYMLDKSGKSSVPLNVVLLILMALLVLHPALSVPWIWSAPDVAMKMWRACLVICVLVLGVSWFGIWTWPIRIQVRPDIAAKIQVDSVEGAVCKFHIELENGSYWLNNVRADTTSELFERSDRIPRSVAPGRKLSLSGSYFNLPVVLDDTLTLRIYFDATVGGVTKHLIQEHRFPLSPQTLNLRTIDPETNSYDEGLPPAPPKMGTPFLSDRLIKDVATVVFDAPEIYEGKPLVFGAKNSSRSRTFAYNAENRRVIFRIVNVNGRVITLDQTLPERKNAKHIIAISWQPLGGSLTVDGKAIQDYDDRPTQPSSMGALPSSAEKSRCVLAKLQIDSVGQEECRFHIELENGEMAVQNLRIRFDTNCYHTWEHEAAGRDMSPGGKLSLPHPHMVLQSGKASDVIVHVYFDAKSQGITKHYIGRFSFPLSESDFREQIIDPESINYSEGLPPTVEERRAEWIAQLKRDEGTMSFGAEEMFENKPNAFGEGDPEVRAYSFNAEAQRVLFRTTTAKGRMITLLQTFTKTKDGSHVIAFGWGPTGGWLSVDGVKTDDYDP
jgi:hypothetical protein